MSFIQVLSYDFMRRAYLAGGLVAALCAIIGMFLVLRHLSLIGDGLSHLSFGTITIALLLGVYPLYVTLPVVTGASIAILALTKRTTIHGDAAIGIVSAVGIATGVIVGSLSQGFNTDLFGYLFGSILLITRQEVYISLVLCIVAVTLIAVLYHDLFSVTFDSEMAHTHGVNTRVIDGILMVLTAITVVLAVRIVGVTLVSALLIIPSVTALNLATQFKRALVWAVVLGVASVWIGITLSFYTDLPTGALIVLINTLFFGLVVGIQRFLRGR